MGWPGSGAGRLAAGVGGAMVGSGPGSVEVVAVVSAVEPVEPAVPLATASCWVLKVRARSSWAWAVWMPVPHSWYTTNSRIRIPARIMNRPTAPSDRANVTAEP